MEVNPEVLYDPTFDGEQLALFDGPAVDMECAQDENADVGVRAGRLSMQLYLFEPECVEVYFYRTNVAIRLNVANFNMLNQHQVRGLAAFVMELHRSLELTSC